MAPGDQDAYIDSLLLKTKGRRNTPMPPRRLTHQALGTDRQGRWRLISASFVLWAACLLAAAGTMAQTKPLVIGDIPSGPLGLYTDTLTETVPLSAEQARTYSQGFVPTKTATPSFGIDAPTIWLRLQLHNPDSSEASINLVAGAPWTDRLDAYLFADGAKAPTAKWHTGDESNNPSALQPATGYVWPLVIPPGRSEILLRAESIDPMVLPLTILTDAELRKAERSSAYQYGLLYGFLIALSFYNLLVFGGTGERSYLYYGLYLVSYIGLNLANTGHGFAWLWPEALGFQRYIILIMMVVFSATGLLFASRFLGLAQHSPRALRAVQIFAGAGLGAMALSIFMNSHSGAAYVAFWFLGLFSLAGVALGVLSLRRGWISAYYFLGAASCALIGAGISVLTVWGWVPFTEWGYRAIEWGVATEATLLALALANQMRHKDAQALQAQVLARTDPLTGLMNRRAFLIEALPLWRTALRAQRPLCVLMLDLDHFKRINDSFGHDAGDQALLQAAQRLARGRRAGDLLARWGGEEFVLLLPETDRAHAYQLAERIRSRFAEEPIALHIGTVALTASIGLAERGAHESIEALIAEADSQLLVAKSRGRNQIAPSP
jgi:diguanylate cyclase (GGDEF)-like protein